MVHRRPQNKPICSLWLLGEFRKGKTLKNIKLANGLHKYKKKLGVCATRLVAAIGFEG